MEDETAAERRRAWFGFVALGRFVPIGRLAAIGWLVAISTVTLGFAGCSSPNQQHAGQQHAAVAQLAASKTARSQADANTLSREHQVEVEVAESELEQRFGRVTDRCTADGSHHCSILESDFIDGKRAVAAIKVASELSTVQANLERVAAEVAYQNKRATSDVVSIDLVVAQGTAYWRPIREAMRDFAGNLSNGLSQAISDRLYRPVAFGHRARSLSAQVSLATLRTMKQ